MIQKTIFIILSVIVLLQDTYGLNNTKNMTIVANLDSRTPINKPLSLNFDVISPLGYKFSIPFYWIKIGDNTWTLSIPPLPAPNQNFQFRQESEKGEPYMHVPITFDEHGNPASFNNNKTSAAAMPRLYIVWLNLYATSVISLNLGAIGSSNGLTQRPEASNLVLYKQDGIEW